MPSFMLTNNRGAERGWPASLGEIWSQTKSKLNKTCFMWTRLQQPEERGVYGSHMKFVVPLLELSSSVGGWPQHLLLFHLFGSLGGPRRLIWYFLPEKEEAGIKIDDFTLSTWVRSKPAFWYLHFLSCPTPFNAVQSSTGAIHNTSL